MKQFFLKLSIFYLKGFCSLHILCLIFDWSDYKRNLFNAGPTLEEKRFDFSIYGAMNFEATELPSNNTITLSLETMNGLDNVPLNCFEASNTATITF